MYKCHKLASLNFKSQYDDDNHPAWKQSWAIIKGKDKGQ